MRAGDQQYEAARQVVDGWPLALTFDEQRVPGAGRLQALEEQTGTKVQYWIREMLASGTATLMDNQRFAFPGSLTQVEEDWPAKGEAEAPPAESKPEGYAAAIEAIESRPGCYVIEFPDDRVPNTLVILAKRFGVGVDDVLSAALRLGQSSLHESIWLRGLGLAKRQTGFRLDPAEPGKQVAEGEGSAHARRSHDAPQLR